ncbi:MAG: TonB-dependent receptor [Flavobacteriaceae bacterium]|nr:TonB-dependent receptor [Flavobacteriaceae bacterium]
MKNYKFFTIGILCLAAVSAFGQSITISGTVQNEENQPVKKAVVFGGSHSVETDSQGKYELSVPANQAVEIEVTASNYEDYKITLSASDTNEVQNFTLKKIKEKQIKEVVFQGNRRTPSDLTSVQISADKLNITPTVSGGIEDILKTLPFVNTNSELSSQYMVRGGNYDENLVYINGMEIYRPMLIRSGQQEGMSIINPDMVSMINFSAGGFETRYGDKMSSVLDITYRRPKSFDASLEASLLGGSATVGISDKKQKFTALIGTRYRNTNLILNTLDGDANYKPVYFDTQAYLQYDFNSKWNLSFLGNYSSNDYEMIPKTKEVTFGSYLRPVKLTVAYNGREKDRYQTLNGALSLKFKPSAQWVFSVDGYGFHTQEQAYSDIAAGYLLQDVNPDTGETTTSFGSGGEIDHVRNNLDMLVTGGQFKGKYNFNVNTSLEAGFQYQTEDIRDLRNEWQLVDSIGYSLPHLLLPPTDLDNSDLVLNYHISAKNNLKSNRMNGYVQFLTKFMWDETKVLINAGVRATHWDFNNETNVSPRFQIALKPDWEMDMLFRFATGLYYQPPFYKEALRLDGSPNENIKSQRSIHFILGNDYEFKLFDDRLFKLTTEIYYKKLDDLIPYYVDNVRVIYTGENNADGYAYGIDARLNGEFVSGAESWVSISYGRTKESIDGQGYIPRPTDQRFKIGVYFQDYMKAFPRFRASVNMLYSSGLPNGAPLFSNPYKYQSTLPDYMRADVGLAYIIADLGENKPSRGSLWAKFKELTLGVDIFNVFDNRNTVNNQWIRDVNSFTSYAVPNYLTGRFFNVKLNAKF